MSDFWIQSQSPGPWISRLVSSWQMTRSRVGPRGRRSSLVVLRRLDSEVGWHIVEEGEAIIIIRDRRMGFDMPINNCSKR